jgi:capsular exopolysaccharide synthesis family protein
MDIGQHFRIIWRRRVPIVLLSLLIAGLVYLWSSRQADVYQANSQVSVDAVVSANSGNLTEATLFKAREYGQLATSTPVLQAAIKKADLKMNVNQLRGKLDVSTSSSVPLIAITSRAGSPTEAIKINEAVGDSLVEYVTARQQDEVDSDLAKLDAEITRQQDIVKNAGTEAEKASARQVLTTLFSQRAQAQTADRDRLEVQGTPFARARPISPKPARDTLLAFVLALIVNSELVVGLTTLGDRFSSERDVARLLAERGIPILGRIPSSRSRPDLLDAFRELRTNLIVHQETAERLRIAVTGVEPRAGKTFVSVHAAQSLADLGFETVLIDADLRAPSVHRVLNLERSPGLTEVLLDGAEPAVDRSEEGSLQVITAGRPVEDAVGLLAGPDFEVLLDKLAATSFVLVDTPPAGLFADAGAVARSCDGYLLVVRAGAGRRGDLEETIGRLDQVGALPLGAVLNRSHLPASRYAYGRHRRSFSPLRLLGRRGRRRR